MRGPQRAELLALLQATSTPEELEAQQPIPPAPKGETNCAIEAMRTVVQVAAEKLALPAGLLCPRRLIEEFAVTRAWPAGLQGWRASLLESDLTPLLPG
jgi:ribonuclease D